MKNALLILGILFTFLACNKDDDNTPEPVIEEEPDLSFPECLLSEDVFEYSLIMETAPSEPRGDLIKFTYELILKSVYNVGKSKPTSIIGGRAYTLNKLDWSNLINLLYKPPPDVTL